MNNLNAPVGYFGNPVFESTNLIDPSYSQGDYQPKSHNNSSLVSLLSSSSNFSGLLSLGRMNSSDSINQQWSTANSIKVNSYKSIKSDFSDSYPNEIFPLMNLPTELLATNIIPNLHQIDKINLMSTCSFFYQLVKPQLWSHIIVDANYNEFNLEKLEKLRIFNNLNFPTFIKTSFRTRLLINSIIRNAKTTDNNNNKLIHKLYFKCLPSDFLTYELRNFLSSSSESLSTLNELIVLRKLGPSLSLSSLTQSMSSGLKSINLSLNLSQSDIMEIKSDSLFPFSQLKDLSISLNFDTNCDNSIILKKIMNSLIKNGNNFKNFEKIHIGNTSTLFNSNSLLSNCLLNSSPRASINDNSVTMDVQVIKNLFSPLLAAGIILTDLKELSFDGIVVIPKQASLIVKAVDLTKLEVLKLENVSEFQFIEAEALHQDRELFMNNISSGFLVRLTENSDNELINLRSLVLDYKECLKDSIIPFLNKLSTSKLNKLNLKIRWNMKSCRVISSLNDYIHDIIITLTNFKNLRKISFDLRREIKPSPFTFITNDDALISHSLLTNHSKFFQSLEFLGLYCEDTTILTHKFPPLDKLWILDLFGPAAGGGPNMALETSYAGVHDNWYKVQHVALHTSQNAKNLQFVRINGYLFEIRRFGADTVAVPQDIGSWIDELA